MRKILIQTKFLILSLILSAPWYAIGTAPKAYADPIYPELISQSQNSEVANGPNNIFTGICSPMHSLSYDGRYALFCSDATNLGSQRTIDSNVHPVYVRDRQSGTTTLVSLNSFGQQENGRLTFAALSGDGHHVLFTTNATNMDSRVTTSTYHNTYIRNIDTGNTILVSVNNDGQLIQGGNGYAISFDGSVVTFNGATAVSSTPPEQFTTYARNISQGITHTINQAGGNLSSRVSGDGRYVAYEKVVSSLLQVFVYDTTNSTSQAASVTQQGDLGNKSTVVGDISHDGHYVMLRTSATNLYESTSQSPCNRYVRHNMATNQNDLADLADGGVDIGSNCNLGSGYPAISPDGNSVVFSANPQTSSGMTYTGETSLYFQIFVHNFSNQRTTLASKNSVGILSDLPNDYPDISYSGDQVLFQSAASNFGVVPRGQVYLTLTDRIYQTDTVPPIVMGIASRSPDSLGWYTSPVVINWTVNDPAPSSGSPTVPQPTTASVEGIFTYTSDQSCDPVNNCTTGSYEIKLDTISPSGALTSTQAVIRLLGQTISGLATDATSGVAQVSLTAGTTTLNSAPGGGLALDCNVTRTSCTWAAVANMLPQGVNNFTLTVKDTASNTSSVTRLYTVI